MQEKLRAYADLVIQLGLRIEKDEHLVIRASLESKDFVLMLTESAYEAGAASVRVDWRCQELSKLHLKHQSDEELAKVDAHLLAREMESINACHKYLSIVGNDPNALSDVDPSKIAITRKASGTAYKEFSSKMMANETSWCVIGAATPSWAHALYPELPVDEAVQKLWDLIFFTMRLNEADPKAAWTQHTEALKRHSAWLNAQGFKTLHYKSAKGTDLHLGLADHYHFLGADEKNRSGQSFIANMPTEEVFSMPHAQRVDGIVYNTRPLNLSGTLVDDFYLRFEEGRVVDFKAGVGHDALAKLLDTDEGARRLGEVALVPYHSPISLTGALFLETLFDENASCHVALGEAYPSTTEDGENLDEETLKARGMNHSLIHVDFMIGDETLEIDGEKEDGTLVPVFRNGDFVID